MVHRRPHPGSPPLRCGDKESPSHCVPGKVPTSSPPRSRKSPVCQPLDCLFEGVARAEGGNPRSRDLHLLAGLGIPALPGLTLPNGELPEAGDLHLLASLERFGHYLLEGFEVLLGLALGHPSFLCDPLDEFLLLHWCSFLWLSSAPRGHALLAYFLFIREPGSLATPSLAADLAEWKLWGYTVGGAPHLAQASREGTWVE